MSDLTLLYYSASVIDDQCGKNLRNELLKTINGAFPIISVTQKPLDFGENICIGEIGQSYYNAYKQMYIGIQRVKTKYVAMIEDDSLYNMEHLSHRPSSDDVFSYNRNLWLLEKSRHKLIFWTKGQTAMLTCIATAELLRIVLEQRFTRFPEEPLPREYQKYAWQEPGKDERLGFANQKFEIFTTKIPVIALNYYSGTGGKQKAMRRGVTIAESLDYWGKASELGDRLFGN